MDEQLGFRRADRNLKVASSGTSYTDLATVGKKAEWDNFCSGVNCNPVGDLTRSVPSQDSGVVYLQFISNFESTGGGGTPRVQLSKSDSSTAWIGNNGVSGNPNNTILLIPGNGSASGVINTGALLNQTHLVILRIDYDNTSSQMWIDPVLSSFDYSNPPSTTLSTSNFAPEFDEITLVFRDGSSIDEIALFSSVYGLNKNGAYITDSTQFLSSTGAINSGQSLSANGNLNLPPDGLTQQTAASSAEAILQYYPSSQNGVYWIDLPTSGPTETYCLMDSSYDGGGWMLAMKSTSTTDTFKYSATYWTDAATTLNSTNPSRSPADAKYEVMNRYPAKDIMGLWPDIPSVGSESGSIDGLTNWSWLQNDFNTTSTNAMTLITLFNGPQITIEGGVNTALTFNGFHAPFLGTTDQVFSSKPGFNFYGFNYTGYQNAKVRWGISSNGESDELSNDIMGGVGLIDSDNYPNVASGDITRLTTGYGGGISRGARAEVYIR